MDNYASKDSRSNTLLLVVVGRRAKESVVSGSLGKERVDESPLNAL